MVPEVVRANRRAWLWAQFVLASGLFPVAFLLWIVGLNDAFGPHHNPLAAGCGIAAPFITMAGAVWLVILHVRRFPTGRRRPFLIIGCLILAALGLFFGTAAFFSPPGKEGEPHVLAVLSGILLIAAPGCVCYTWAEFPARQLLNPPTSPETRSAQ
jgi:hypothetical protein